MPSWNEKPVIIPEINVNLEHQCPSWCPKTHDGSHDVEHAASCYARPVAIPCPVKRSAVFMVTLGECRCINKDRAADGNHADSCPGRPIRVACSIGGDGTWAGSEVSEVERSDHEQWLDQLEEMAALRVCRERWALVKALVLGHAFGVFYRHEAFSGLFAQRDAVFAALCEMARAECAARKACEDLWAHVAEARGWGYAHIADAVDRVSAHLLAVYVEHLIEQVGVLP